MPEFVVIYKAHKDGTYELGKRVKSPSRRLSDVMDSFYEWAKSNEIYREDRWVPVSVLEIPVDLSDGAYVIRPVDKITEEVITYEEKWRYMD